MLQREIPKSLLQQLKYKTNYKTKASQNKWQKKKNSLTTKQYIYKASKTSTFKHSSTLANIAAMDF